MEDKETEQTPEPEPSMTFLQEVQKEREELAKEREETAKLVTELKELRAEQIISGKIDSGKTAEKPKEKMSNVDYANAAMAGENPDAD